MANTFPHHPLVQANSTHKIPDAPKVIASKAPVPARQVSVDQNHRLSLQEPHVKACDGVTLEMLHKLICELADDQDCPLKNFFFNST